MSTSNRRSRVLLQAVAAMNVIAGLAIVARADLPITQVVVTGDPAPDGGTYVSFGAPISVDRQTPVEVPNIFAFQATTSNNVSGVYYYSYNDPAHGGNLLQYGTVADTTQTAPTGGAYASFSNLSGGYGELGFIATDSDGNQGVYSEGQSSPLTLIATPQTLTPTGIPFGNFQSVSIMSYQYFGIEGGEIESDAGIYEFDSFGGPHGNQLEFNLVANTATTPPGAAGPFTSFGPISFKNKIPDFGETPGLAGDIRAVQATVGGVEGIYWAVQAPGLNTGGYVQIAQVGAATPNGTGHFTSFGNLIATSNETIFTANYSTTSGGQQGIFAYGPYEAATDFVVPPFGPELHELVAVGQVAPDSGGATFTGFSEISDSSYNDAFIANLSNGEEGLYVYVGEETNIYASWFPPPELLKVIATGDMLDGKVVSGIELSPDGSNYYDLSSDGYVLGIDFEVDFTDGSESLDYFIVPEPASLCLMALPLLLLPRRRRSSKLTAMPMGSVIEPLEQRRLLSSPPLTTPIGIDAVTDSMYGGLVAGCDDPTVEADNTTILNAAITAADSSHNGTSGGVVYLPEGVYYFSGSIDLLHLVTLRGESATGENDGTNGTIIDYTGGDTAIKLKPASNGNLWNVGVENLTIESNGAGLGLYYPGDANDPPHDVVRFDMENVKFETEGTAIDLPREDGGEAAQNSYFHNIDISVGGPESSDPETSIYLASGAEAVDLGGNANDIDGLTIEGTPATGYSPSNGLVDIESAKVILLKDINIPATFGSQSITDLYIYRSSNVAIQDVWINQAFAGSENEPAGSNTEYEIIQSDVTIDSLTLDSTDILDVDPASLYQWQSHVQPSIVVVDSVQMDTENGTTQTLANCIQANSLSEVHVTLATQPYVGSWPTGINQPALDSSGVLVPYEGVDVENADPDHVVSPSNSAETNHDNLQWWISTYPGTILYLPAGFYNVSNLLTIPSGTYIDGEGEFSTTISCDDSAVLSFYNPGGSTEFSNVTISNIGLENSSGAGINADYSSLTGTDNISNFSVNQVYFQTAENGIDLPAPDADITDGSFVNLYLNGNSPGLIAIHVDGNTAGNVTTLEECNDPQGSGPVGPIVSVVSDPDSTEPVFVYSCDEERTNAVFFELSGPDISFFANYISDGSSLNCVQLDDASNFQADSLPSGGYYGSGSLITDSDVYVRILDGSDNNGSYDNNENNEEYWFYNSSDLSRSIMDVDASSAINIDVVRFFDGAVTSALGLFYPTSAGLADSILTDPIFQISVSNVTGVVTDPSRYKVLGDPDYPNLVPLGFNDVIIPNGSSNLTSSSTDPNQISVTGASNTTQINVTSNDYPYIIGSGGGGDTLTLDWSNGTPDFAGSPYFNASGTGNKLIVDDPADADDLTFVQGPPPADTPGTIGMDNVQEIDTGSGTYNVTLDFSNSRAPTSGIYYDGLAGSGNTLILKGSHTYHSFSLVAGSDFDGYAYDIGVAGVQTVGVYPISGVTYSLTIQASVASTVFNLAEDSGNSSLIDVYVNNNTGTPNYIIDPSGGVNTIDLWGVGGYDNIDVGPLSSGITYYLDTYQEVETLFINGQPSATNNFSVFSSSIIADGTTFYLPYEAPGATVLVGSTAGDSDSLTLNVGGSLPSLYYEGTSDNLSLYAQGAGSYVYSVTAYGVTVNGHALGLGLSGSSSVTINGGGGNDSFALNFEYGPHYYVVPGFALTFNGSGGSDSVSVVNVPSSINSFVAKNDSTSTNEIDIGTYALKTSEIQTATINGGVAENNFTVERGTNDTIGYFYSTLNINGNFGDGLDIDGATKAADSTYITATDQVYLGKSGSTYLDAINYSRGILVYLDATSGQVNTVGIDTSAEEISVTEYGVEAFADWYSMSNFTIVDIEGGTTSDMLDYTPFIDSTTQLDSNGPGGTDELSNNYMEVYFTTVTAIWFEPTSDSSSLEDDISIPLTLTSPVSGSLISLDQLTVGSNAAVNIVSGAGDQLYVNSLDLGNTSPYGTLNLGDSIFTIGQTGSDIDAKVFAWLASAYNAGAWNGTGIASSDFATGQSIGYFDDDATVTIKKTWLGDTDVDGDVDSQDFDRMETGLGSGGSLTGWQNGDFNYDGYINQDDVALFQSGNIDQ